MVPVHYHGRRFPPAELDWPRLIPLIGPAATALARYDGMLGSLPNPELLRSPLMTQEAVLSSRIEGTQATMGEVLEFEAEKGAASPEKEADIQEVLNYRAAMQEAEHLLARLPLSQRVIRDAHRVLLQGVRGQNKAPGEYRRIPNWIGPPGCTIEEARFIPISADRIPVAMGDWERYAHADTVPDRLVQAAILHAEFEALHPFLDGNGRLGRMLIPLFLWQVGVIHRPMFYISAFFETHRDAYYDRLLSVSRDNDWTGWCTFFLRAVTSQAEDNQRRVRAIQRRYDELKGQLPEMTRSQYAVLALDWIFQRPVFLAPEFVRVSGIPGPTARRILRILREEGILGELRPASGRRAAVLAFPELLNLAEGRGVL